MLNENTVNILTNNVKQKLINNTSLQKLLHNKLLYLATLP
ncbi:hypothetical protein EMUCRT_0543 [Ehrlichia cf. muris str. EmCRT]|uniref:Uncharacterized protein n=1 Tax=Ehrlichia cf. muris str. EmCRT TaxID=1359167 RepID=A0A0F3NC05_9RICK|nr:hypothetical protein EMUCRT_0543 [Ehrlichia cf. muris str. EmCRT]